MPDRSRLPRVHTIDTERLILREPNSHCIRAVLETVVDDQSVSDVPGRQVQLRLLRPDGSDGMVLRVDALGEAFASVGPPDHGTSLILTPREMTLWHAGNSTLSAWSHAHGGSLQLYGPNGTPLRSL